MDYLECYCGNLITSHNGVEHLIYCQAWQSNSGLFRNAKKMIKNSDLYLLMRIECEALLQFPFNIGEQEDFPGPQEYSILCHLCRRGWPDMNNLLYLGCDHIVCNTHIRETIYNCYPRSERVMCPSNCGYALSIEEIQQIVPEEELKKLEPSLESILDSQGGIMAQCSCGNLSWLEPGNPDYNYKENGKTLSKRHAEHMAKFRFRCPCSKVTCASCKAEPYHVGMTCEEFSEFKLSKHCRYCSKTIKNGEFHCKNDDCKKRFRNSCKKTLKCGHICFGTNEETHCSECLEEDCGGRGNDYCTICHIEGLSSAPSVFLTCGHIFHYHCLHDTLRNRWPGPRITFKFSRCPACNSWIDAPYNPSIIQETNTIQGLYREILDKALKRLQFEGKASHPKLSQSESQYYNNPEKYSLDTFSYYQCYNCKKSYFGGKRDCEQNNDAAKYDPKDLVCPACSAIGKEGADCPKHGKEYIEFKCKFCCGISAWFCWGTTHFCDSCHTRQNNGDYMSKKNRSELPACPGPASCPLKVSHPANGEEFALGCSLCRNLIDNSKEF